MLRMESQIDRLQRQFSVLGLGHYSLEYASRFFGSKAFRTASPTRFLILCSGRSGSTLLADMLNNHPHIFCDGEVFGAMPKSKLRSPSDFLSSRSRLTGRMVYGCKVKIYDLTQYQQMSMHQSSMFLTQLYQNGWKFIHIRRTNLFLQALSSLVAEHRKAYHFMSRSKFEEAPMHLDADSLPWRIRLLQTYQEQENYVLRTLEHLSINYERDLYENERHQSTLDLILDHLELERVKAKSEFVRTSSDNPSKYISNYTDLITKLRGTDLERYLVT